eukprot:TRINITY_DN18366_c0_g2_i1.p1 TRINITY_DN18366_c0_g2~~TRINITY_DN18366_c0_g2_i1.p1  ORF type:complete len:285 (+),score=89.32 TRINITY_DN18366_c0_g2_i1:87-941(+)
MTALAERSVVETFLRFDLEGDGTIDRSELGKILRQVQPGAWNDDELDHLLWTADANGDGRIHMQDFLQWIFAGADDMTAGVASSKSLNMEVRDVEHVARTSVVDPPTSLDDLALIRYALEEQVEGWYVELVGFDSSTGEARLANGMAMRVAAAESGKLERLLAEVPEGAVVSGLLERTKAHVFDERSQPSKASAKRVAITDFEHVAATAVGQPPRSLTDPALLRYLAEYDGQGWYVAVASLDDGAAVLSNGGRIPVAAGEAEALARLLASTPDYAVVSGLLRLA